MKTPLNDSWPGIIALFVMLGSVCAIQANSQEKPVNSDVPRENSAKAPSEAERVKPATISVTQEKSILAFVLKHDTSLHSLLGNLRNSRPKEYQTALADLHRATERLAQIKRNRPHAYDLEVKKWQAQSKVQMLAARLAMRPDPDTRVKLKQAIEERANLELQVWRADRDATAKRLKHLDEQIALSESTMQSRVQQQFDRSVAASRKARSAKSSDSPKKRPASESAIPTRQEAPNKEPSSKEPDPKTAPKSDTPAKSSKREGASS